MGIETINPQGLTNQQFSIVPVDAIPTECPKFPVPESSAQPQEEQRVEPRLFCLDVLQNLLDVLSSQHITMNGGLRDFELIGEQGLGLG